ncbi:MAG: HlyD family efflux transporter periplasmic adaptor subunit [Syntrophales bacterium]
MKNGRTWVGWPGKKRIWLLIVVVVCGFVTAFLLLDTGVSLRGKPPAASVTPVKTDVTCLGRLLPGGRILQVAGPSGALIGELLVRRGQWVERGEILARLRDHARDTAALQQADNGVAVAISELERVRAGEKTIEAQQAAVARQEAVLRQEEANYERNRRLSEKQIIAAKEFEEAETRRDTARQSLLWERRQLAALQEVRKEDLALAGNKIEAARGARNVARETLELNLIRAPASGRVLDIYAFAGEAIPARGLLELGSGRDMLVEAEVYVSDIGRVRIGAPAVVTGDAFRERLQGRVVEIVSMVARSTIMPIDPLAFSDLRVVKVWIALEDSQAVAQLGNHQVSVAIKP